MPEPEDYSFVRYLAAKKSVDDRALNRRVFEQLKRQLPAASPEHPLAVLEVGAGIGTMLERLLEWEALSCTGYTALDADPANITHARHRIENWGTAHGYRMTGIRGGLSMEKVDGCQVDVSLRAADFFDFVAQKPAHQSWDLLVANAFLDLVDLPTSLPLLFSCIKPGGWFYFTLNFDGLSIFEPVTDPAADARIIDLYHRSMDERLVNSHPSGDSRAGRHLFDLLSRSGGQIHAAGSSDWVVYPGPQGYPEDEAYFLHFIIHTIDRQLENHPELDSRTLKRWVSRRHAQIERGELVYIAHQLDFMGQFAGK